MTPDANNVGSPHAEHAEAPAAGEYWTEERRRAAQPVPMSKTPLPQPGAPAPHLPQSHPGQTPSGHGRDQDAGARSDSLTAGHAVLQPLSYPYRTCGKIYFNQSGGSYSGSAAMVAPNVLLTAGHCVYGGGHWSTNMVFYPSYGTRTATDPAYRFNCGRLSCRTSYVQNGNRAHDYALVWMGAAPGNVVGWLGLLWGASTAGRVWEAVGYPATPHPPYDGSTMEAAVGSVHASSTAGTIGLTNDDMEHGSSGGPWITAWNETVRSHANGLQSFHLKDGDTVEYGPYFTDEVKSLFDWISNPANH